MKVLFNTYPMAFDTPGGGEMQLIAYKKYLPAYGVYPELFDLWNPQFDEYDFVHFFATIAGSKHFCNHVKNIGLPLAITSSLWVTNETSHLYPMDEIKSQLILADSIITNSELESQQLSKITGIDKSKFKAVYNGIEDLFLDKIKKDYFFNKTNQNKPFILCVGNIEPRKNQLNLIKAIKAFPSHNLVLIGYIRERDYAQRCFNEGGSQVKYLGALPHRAKIIRAAMSSCDVFVIPSTLETPSLAALEAGAQGANIAITEVGSTKEYFKNYVDYLNPVSIESIVNAIGNAIQKKHNNELSDFIANNYLWKNTISKLRDVYQSIA